MTPTQKTPWAEFLWANAHIKKIPDSYGVNTEDTMGRIPMGETLAQEEKKPSYHVINLGKHYGTSR